MRSTARATGRALLRLATRLWQVDLPVGTPRSIVVAACADRCGLSPISLARLVGYDEVQTVCAAALKLLPLDPAATTRWALETLPVVEALASTVAAMTTPEAIPAAGSPQLDTWAQAHAVTTRRLFSA
jgi:urease accessory protein